MNKKATLYLVSCQETARPRCQSAFDDFNGCPSGLMKLIKRTKSKKPKEDLSRFRPGFDRNRS